MNDPTQGQSLESQIARLQGDLTQLINVMYRGIERRLSPYGVAVGEYAVLAACFFNEPITITGITQHVPLEAGRVSRIVSKFEDRNLVLKVRPKSDRRTVWVRMTDEGRALVPVFIKHEAEHYGNVMSRVSEQELVGLIAFIEKMTENAVLAKEELG